MKSSSAFALLLAVAAVGGGIVYLSTKSSTPKDVRRVRVFAGFGDNPEVWAFTVDNGMPPRPGQPPVLLHGPDGPYASQEAAQTAGNNWLTEHPLV